MCFQSLFHIWRPHVTVSSLHIPLSVRLHGRWHIYTCHYPCFQKPILYLFTLSIFKNFKPLHFRKRPQSHHVSLKFYSILSFLFIILCKKTFEPLTDPHLNRPVWSASLLQPTAFATLLRKLLQLIIFSNWSLETLKNSRSKQKSKTSGNSTFW